jgi:hypothetical protein
MAKAIIDSSQALAGEVNAIMASAISEGRNAQRSRSSLHLAAIWPITGKRNWDKRRT